MGVGQGLRTRSLPSTPYPGSLGSPPHGAGQGVSEVAPEGRRERLSHPNSFNLTAISEALTVTVSISQMGKQRLGRGSHLLGVTQCLGFSMVEMGW